MNFDIELNRFINEHKKMSDQGNWHLFPDDRKRINQTFVDKKDSKGLLKFYENAIKHTFLSEELPLFEELRLSLDKLTDDIQKAVKRAMSCIKPKTVAVYCEYDTRDLTFYYCPNYDENDDFWASEFFDETVDGNVNVAAVAYKVGDWDLRADKDSFLFRYIDAFFLKILFDAVTDLGITMKVGFAKHDREIVTINR